MHVWHTWVRTCAYSIGHDLLCDSSMCRKHGYWYLTSVLCEVLDDKWFVVYINTGYSKHRCGKPTIGRPCSSMFLRKSWVFHMSFVSGPQPRQRVSGSSGDQSHRSPWTSFLYPLFRRSTLHVRTGSLSVALLEDLPRIEDGSKGVLNGGWQYQTIGIRWPLVTECKCKQTVCNFNSSRRNMICIPLREE